MPSDEPSEGPDPPERMARNARAAPCTATVCGELDEVDGDAGRRSQPLGKTIELRSPARQIQASVEEIVRQVRRRLGDAAALPPG